MTSRKAMQGTGRTAWLTGFLVTAVVVSTLGFVREWSRKSSYLPCVVDCAETFLALHQAQNVRLHDSLFGLLENHETGRDPSSRGYFYTGNTRIGSTLFQVLEWLGVRELKSKQLATLAIFGL